MSYFLSMPCGCGAIEGQACLQVNGEEMLDAFHASRRFDLLQDHEGGKELISSGTWRAIADDGE